MRIGRPWRSLWLGGWGRGLVIGNWDAGSIFQSPNHLITNYQSLLPNASFLIESNRTWVEGNRRIDYGGFHAQIFGFGVDGLDFIQVVENGCEQLIGQFLGHVG